jgi:hypothetical protein
MGKHKPIRSDAIDGSCECECVEFLVIYNGPSWHQCLKFTSQIIDIVLTNWDCDCGGCVVAVNDVECVKSRLDTIPSAGDTDLLHGYLHEMVLWGFDKFIVEIDCKIKRLS